jgi:glutamate synthase (NADPH/NADH) large chain
VEVFDHSQIKHHVTRRAYQREMPGITSRYGTNTYPPSSGIPMTTPKGTPGTRPSPAAKAQPVPAGAMQVALPLPDPLPESATVFNTAVLSAMGWQREHLRELDSLATSGKDLVGSLGHDGPLAVLSHNRVNVADFFKETVAVVTNPSIDRGREGEAFSTAVMVGPRPEVDAPPHPAEQAIEIGLPLLSGGHPVLGGLQVAEDVAHTMGTLSFEALTAAFEGRVASLILGIYTHETTETALERLAMEAMEAARAGVQCIILDDSITVNDGLGWLDPHLATAFIDDALRDSPDVPNLRRRVGVVVRSASVRTLHDIALLCGFGADAINPYAMLGVAINAYKGRAPEDPEELTSLQVKLLKALKVGLEKVVSTMGCHELRAYGRVFSSIGLAPDVAEVFATPNYFGSAEAGLTWAWLDEQADTRAAEIRGEGGRSRLAKVDRFYPKFWKKVENYGTGEGTYQEILDTFERLTTDIPVALRHILGLRTNADTSIDPNTVDISVDGYDLPLVISAMSFGSQGELSYKAYAQAAEALNIICVNGEGGELPELMGIYKRNRGQQVASGRFGVNAEFLNSSAVIEIKIGQGAKPGEGGMLPGYKVTPQVASARHTNPYVPLLSPSNNHDLYSIEDLAQLIEELKTVNPEAKVSVKCPVVPGIGVIAVGVAKAGADIITLTGYDGATGAARKHALQYVGLPAEIGVIQAHRALSEAGLRRQVEIWCDGGMKTGSDVVKMVLLGANRVGMATMAMVAIGCTICRKCNEGTCHVGITTHIKTEQEAEEKGLPSFVPRVYDESVHGIIRVFRGIGAEIQELVAGLGAQSLQELVGRADLLTQSHAHDRIDLSTMFEPVPLSSQLAYVPGVGRLLTRPRNNLTRIINELVMETLEQGVPEATYQDEVMAYDRAIAANIAGELQRRPDLAESMKAIHMRFGPSSIAGNGLAAWVTSGIDILIEGGGQDGVAKGASGGRVAVMKGLNHDGNRIDGSVGKSFAYGAQSGVLIVQGNADSRACIRLSGADVILGGEITRPVDDSLGSIGTHANLKGFACEYMTSGRVLILGDPGPYAFAGMTGGVVYQLLTPGMGFTVDVLMSRFAEGANVCVENLTEGDYTNIQELLGFYIDALERTDQRDVAERIWALSDPHIMRGRFVKIVPAYEEKRL